MATNPPKIALRAALRIVGKARRKIRRKGAPLKAENLSRRLLKSSITILGKSRRWRDLPQTATLSRACPEEHFDFSQCKLRDEWVDLTGFEPVISSLQMKRIDQLCYRPESLPLKCYVVKQNQEKTLLQTKYPMFLGMELFVEKIHHTDVFSGL